MLPPSRNNIQYEAAHEKRSQIPARKRLDGTYCKTIDCTNDARMQSPFMEMPAALAAAGVLTMSMCSVRDEIGRHRSLLRLLTVLDQSWPAQCMNIFLSALREFERDRFNESAYECMRAHARAFLDSYLAPRAIDGVDLEHVWDAHHEAYAFAVHDHFCANGNSSRYLMFGHGSKHMHTVHMPDSDVVIGAAISKPVTEEAEGAITTSRRFEDWLYAHSCPTRIVGRRISY